MKNARDVLMFAMMAVEPKEVSPAYIDLLRQDTFLWVRDVFDRKGPEEFREWLDARCDGVK